MNRARAAKRVGVLFESVLQTFTGTRPSTIPMPPIAEPAACELCAPADILLESEHAYVRYDNNTLSRGHVLVVPRRHVASFFDMTSAEQADILGLLTQAQSLIQAKHSPDGYNIGVNVGKAAGQSRMHVHVHLIPRYAGDVADPSGGIRCVLSSKTSRS